MTNALKQAAQQALEAMEDHANQYPHMQKGYTVDAIEALRAALAAPQAQPVVEAVATVSVMGSYMGKPAYGCLIDWDAQEQGRVKIGDKLYTAPQPAAQPSVQDLAAGALYPQVSAWGAPQPAAPAPEPISLLWQCLKALSRAEAICDAVPNRQPGHLGKLVNVQPDGTHGYREIADAHEALAKYLTEPEAAPAPERVPQWQPIETAPKDGRRVLLAIDGVSRAVVGIWNGSAWDTVDGNCWAGRAVTHWMSLPTAPSTTPKEQQ